MHSSPGIEYYQKTRGTANNTIKTNIYTFREHIIIQDNSYLGQDYQSSLTVHHFDLVGLFTFLTNTTKEKKMGVKNREEERYAIQSTNRTVSYSSLQTGNPPTITFPGRKRNVHNKWDKLKTNCI